jgi:V8-like Glu-specific endopeptidase
MRGNALRLYPLLLPIVGLVAACGRYESESQTSVVIGSNDLYEASSDLRLTDALGRVQKGCTASHLGNGLVLTAGHCITANECAEAFDVTWGRTGQNPSGTLSSKCAGIVYIEESNERDFALYRVEPYPDISLALSDVDIESIGEVSAFSYPGSRNLLNSGPCQLLGPDFGDRWFHNCDTEKGSSGAPILDSAGQIVAIHNRGSNILSKNSGTKAAAIRAQLD